MATDAGPVYPVLVTTFLQYTRLDMLAAALETHLVPWMERCKARRATMQETLESIS